MKIHHIGYLVKNIDKAKASFIALGFIAESEVVYDKYRDVDILFLIKDGYRVELVMPKSSKSVVAELMVKYKNSPYHICYEVSDIMDGIKYLASNKFMQIDEPEAAPAIGGKRVCFMLNPQIGIVELLENRGK